MATIFALSSGRGAAGVAVIRVSGPDSGNAITGLTGREVPKAREAALRRLVNPGTGTVLDQAMVVWFPGPASFTGEDSAEFHVHGGRAVVAAVLEALGEQPGLRPAQPGEFTRRAVFNGKMDLTAAEGIADLVAAETEAQRRQALRQAGGELAAIYGAWREALLALRAEIEALIDFPDEDLPEGLEAQLRERLGKLRAAMGSHLAKANAGERVREGFHVAILGPPNVGKSSLINSLAKRGVAIVSDIPGTTRDVLEVHLDLDGLPVVVSDTAGIRETQEAIEMEGVARARARAESADFRVVLCDSLAWPALPAEMAQFTKDRGLLVVSRCDLRPELVGSCGGALPISVVTGQGLGDLVGVIAKAAEAGLANSGEAVPTRPRHRFGLQQCMDALDRAMGVGPMELRAEELRIAGDALGRLTGAVDVEDVLDRIFREFCIGK